MARAEEKKHRDTEGTEAEVAWAVKNLLLICVWGVVPEPAFDSADRHRIFVSSQPGAERGSEAAQWCFETGNTDLRAFGRRPYARGLGCVLRRGPQAKGGTPQLPS